MRAERWNVANTRLLEMQARERAGMPEAWQMFKWECFPKLSAQTIYVEITGAVAPLITRGKRKGQPNWRKFDRSTEKTIVITLTDADKWAAEWSAKTGL